jgi:hypothetical protein
MICLTSAMRQNVTVRYHRSRHAPRTVCSEQLTMDNGTAPRPQKARSRAAAWHTAALRYRVDIALSDEVDSVRPLTAITGAINPNA